MHTHTLAKTDKKAVLLIIRHFWHNLGGGGGGGGCPNPLGKLELLVLHMTHCMSINTCIHVHTGTHMHMHAHSDT